MDTDMEESMIQRLNELARSGSVKASLFLKGLYLEGKEVGMDEGKVYKYICYAALAGHLDSAIELYDDGKDVTRCFIEDIDMEDWNSSNSGFTEM